MLLNGIRELDIEKIPEGALKLINNMRREENYEKRYDGVLDLLESYFTQAGELIGKNSELNNAKASGKDTYSHEFEIIDRMGHFESVLEDILFAFHQLPDKHPHELDILVSAAKNFIVYVRNLPYERKDNGVRIVDVSAKKSPPVVPTGYHQ
ncbi:MAG: hypothetical protein J7K73_02895 [Nanoarchaeota archaeon]|nr:hypothetical protein [Nanoarchaeota archaeon]